MLVMSDGRIAFGLAEELFIFAVDDVCDDDDDAEFFTALPLSLLATIDEGDGEAFCTELGLIEFPMSSVCKVNVKEKLFVA